MNTYYVYCPDFDETAEDAKEIYARDAKQAVTKWAEDYASNEDYSSIEWDEIRPTVRVSSNGQEWKNYLLKRYVNVFYLVDEE